MNKIETIANAPPVTVGGLYVLGIEVPHIAGLVSIIWICILAYFRFRKEWEKRQETKRLRALGIEPDVIKEFRRWQKKREKLVDTEY